MAARKRGRPFSMNMPVTMIPTNLFDQVSFDNLINGCADGPRWDYFNVWLVIRLRMCRTNGFYLEYNDLVVSTIAREGHFSPDLVREAVSAMLECGVFSKDVFERKSILTGENEQDDFIRYKKASTAALSDLVRDMADIWLLPMDPDDSEQRETQPPQKSKSDPREWLIENFPGVDHALIDHVIKFAEADPAIHSILRYANGILEDCKKKGISTIEAFEKDKQTHDAQKVKRQQDSTRPDPSLNEGTYADVDKYYEEMKRFGMD